MLQSFNKLDNSFSSIPNWFIFCSLAASWMAVQIYFFQSLGVKFVPDSIVRYIPYANYISENGQFGEGQENRYILYILFLAFFIKFKLGFGTAILAQIAVSGIACILLYFAVRNLTNGNRMMAYLATILFIFWKDVQYLNVYILTESLFTSSIICVLYLLTKGNSGKHCLAALLFSLIPTLLRPNGFIVLFGVLACLCYMYSHFIMQHKKAAILACSIILGVFLVFLDKYLLTTFQIVETYARGEIIYASDIYAVAAEHVVMPAEESSPVFRILFFIFLNPILFAKVFFLKLILFIAYMKPYYSLLHNLLIFCVIYPLYFFTGYFLIKGKAVVVKILVLL